MDSFQAYCPQCNAVVSVMTMGTPAEVKTALTRGWDVEGMHQTDASGDHRWNISEHDKDNLRKHLATLER